MNNEANQTAIAEAGGIPLLIELLEAGTDSPLRPPQKCTVMRVGRCGHWLR